MTKKAFCLLIGKFPTYLEHIAPLAIDLNIPLVITEPEIYQLAKKYYPDSNIIRSQLLHIYSYFIPTHDIMISCSQPKILKAIFPQNKCLEFYWMPHGASDKGMIIKDNFTPLKEEKHLLVYGQNLKNLINTHANLEETSFSYIKNYRYYHFLKNKSFYVKKLSSLKLDKSKPVLLYAPTWNDQDNSSSFSSCDILLEKTKKNYQVICKWHPNLLWQEPEKINEIESAYNDICFLKEFPLIYPLLSITDIYVGDMSSVGYDFLTYEKPMVFLNEHGKNLPLFSCGPSLRKKQYPQILRVIDEAISGHKEKYLSYQKNLYKYTFGKKESSKCFNNYFQNFKEKLFSKKWICEENIYE